MPEESGQIPAAESSSIVFKHVDAGATTVPILPLEPTQPEERISVIDVLRGFALFGIVAANMRGFAGPLYAYFRVDALWNTPGDFWVQALVDTFIQGKFISIFAFLFGVGFALQFSRVEERHGPFVQVYRRRLLALILIGLLHQLLFWWGDVLVTYGIGGFLLILFRKRKNKTILIWALALMLTPIVGGTGYLAFRHFRPAQSEKVVSEKKKAEEERQKSEAEMRDTIKVYQTGTYAGIFEKRLGELWQQNRFLPFSVVITLPLFMFGLLVYRRGIFQDPESHRPALKKAMLIGAIAGLPANVATTYIMYVTSGQTQLGTPTALQMFGFFLFTFGRPVMSMCYVSGIVLLFSNIRWRSRLMRFAAIGRTALSNYLFQTVFCTTIFFGYGGGLYGKVHLLALLILSIAVYGLEIPLSKAWLAHYRFGPVEWAWRSMTYNKLQPMKL